MNIDYEISVNLIWGLILNQSIKSELAWKAPHELKLRMQLNPFTLESFVSKGVEEIGVYIAQKPSLHRFPNKMADYLHTASKHIVNQYNGHPQKIWANKSSEEIITSFCELKGINHHKACIGIIILNMLDSSIECNNDITKSVQSKCCNFFNTIHDSLGYIIGQSGNII